jgi:hypothetical protein
MQIDEKTKKLIFEYSHLKEEVPMIQRQVFTLDTHGADRKANKLHKQYLKKKTRMDKLEKQLEKLGIEI